MTTEATADDLEMHSETLNAFEQSEEEEQSGERPSEEGPSEKGQSEEDSSKPSTKSRLASKRFQDDSENLLDEQLSLLEIESERQVSQNNVKFGLPSMLEVPRTGKEDGKRTTPSAFRRFHNASCALCDELIRSERWMCKDCPAWNVCGMCIKMVMCDHEVHPQHTLIRIMLPIDVVQTMPRYWDIREQRYVPSMEPILHTGDTCSVCEQSIIGIRYECAVKACRFKGVLFCQDCEALPLNEHPRTHPLLKYKASVEDSIDIGASKLHGTVKETSGTRKVRRKKQKHKDFQI